MPKPVICFDFDGTLVDALGRIHPNDVEILATEQRVMFIPTTGRPHHAVKQTFEGHGLFVNTLIPFPLVLLNGAALYRENEALLAQNFLSPDVQSVLLDLAVNYPDVASMWFGLDTIHVLFSNSASQSMARRFALNTQPFAEDDRQLSFAKLMCVAETPEPLRPYASAVADLRLDYVYSMPTVLEVNRVGIDKGYGVVAVLEALGLYGADIFVAGDGGNDLPLFERAALSFAPDTSPEFIRDRADHVIEIHETGLLRPILQVVGLR